jgi:hypothetical protein
MTPTPQLSELAAEWHEARLLYPLYAALAREFVIDLPAHSDLESGVDAPPQESVEQSRQLFQDMDARIQVHQLRQFLQTTTISSDDALRTLLMHHLRRAEHSDSDRDKVDFLLVQFFSHCAPSRLEDADVDVAYVAQTLETVLGPVDLTAPEWLNPLDEVLQMANGCRNLNQLLTSRILEKGRKLKTSCGQKYFVPVVMVAFTRFSFLMRRIFFRLMHQDLNAILDGLRELEHNGVETLDCRRAQFSAEEPIARLRMICQSWKVMFHAEYSSGQPVSMLVDLRAVVEAALAKNAKHSKSAPAAKPAAAAKTRAQAAGAEASSDVPDFEVSGGSPDWSENTPTGQQDVDDSNPK